MKREGEQIPLIGLARVGDQMHIGLEAMTGSRVELRILNSKQTVLHQIKVEEHPLYLGYFCAELDDEIWKNTEFQVLVEDKPIIFPQAKAVREHTDMPRQFGQPRDISSITFGWEAAACPPGWMDDRPVNTDAAAKHAYKLHIRGFTQATAGRRAGTFAGLQARIDYLQELAVTHLISFPIYDFEEVLPTLHRAGMPVSVLGLPYPIERSNTAKDAAPETQDRVQYWGYAPGFYYAVKATYAAGNDPAYELRSLIMALHNVGIAFLPEFYFPDGLPYAQMLAILRYWLTAFHLDGVRILGNIDRRALLDDPIIGSRLCLFDEQGGTAASSQQLRLLSFDRGQLIKAAVKSDAGCMYELSRQFLPDQQQWCGISRHDGFTLADNWMYQSRHNRPNGEFGRDGREDEASWNVGIEGPTKSRKINQLRLRLAKNTLVLQLLGGASPLTISGDEYLHSHAGNNNPYCLDEALNYQKWRHTKTEKEFMRFFQQMLKLSMNEPLLQGGAREQGKTVRLLGYPTLSFHGLEPWKQDFGADDRQLAVLLCREYDGDQGAMEVDALYLMINCHWLKQEFYLPSLPSTYGWQPVFDTALADSFAVEAGDGPIKAVTLSGRSIVLYRCVRKKKSGGGV
ncbi:MAG: hypothetical protein Q4D52_03425 [Eubacteriales bacterium]|nr:hypothetical protein [Eubacteriales bacterium]